MSLIDAYGVDPEDFVWQDLSTCSKYYFETNDFFDNYISSPSFARQIDQMCASCPVVKECAQAAQDNKEYGVWGGVYWSNGKIDKEANKHKTKEDWSEVEKSTGIVV